MRIGVAFLKEHQGEDPVAATFEIFVLHHKDLSKIGRRRLEKNDEEENSSHNKEDYYNNYSEEVELHDLLVRQYMIMELNRELANGHREFDGTTTMTHRQGTNTRYLGAETQPETHHQQSLRQPQFDWLCKGGRSKAHIRIKKSCGEINCVYKHIYYISTV